MAGLEPARALYGPTDFKSDRFARYLHLLDTNLTRNPICVLSIASPFAFMRKTATKLSKVKINGRPFWCVTWPKIGKGRNRQFFKDKIEAATFLEQKLIEQENYGITGVSFNERHRAEYLECAEALQPFGVTIREAVKFYIPHLQALQHSCTVAQLVDEVLKVKEADGASRRYLSDLRSRLKLFSEVFDG